ncbi:MAG: YciI family protein [Streptosporangiaceae bacterium]
MARYLISFDGHAMDHIPEDEMPEVARASHAVVQEALNAGVYLFAGGLDTQRAAIVGTDETVTDGPDPQATDLSGGFTIIDVPTREAALEWAAKIAAACRCAQEVREFGPDPELAEMLRRADAGA